MTDRDRETGPRAEVLIRGGPVFDGTGSDGVLADVAVAGGRVVAIGPELPSGPDTEVVDARGRWVMPGFVDLHTHYDAEVELAPALSESLRHGVTTVVLVVTVTLVLSDTAYDDALVLDEPAPAQHLMDAWSAPVGTAVNLGPFALGAELVFAIDVLDTGDHWQSGPGSRNADGLAHVAVTYEGGCSWLIGFEDLYGGGDLDYNDVVFRVEGLLVEQ